MVRGEFYIAEICSYRPFEPWGSGVRLIFKNRKRFYRFVYYYTSYTESLIRVYWGNRWVQTFRNGKEIWNCW